MKIDWKRKLTSRKLWVALAGFGFSQPVLWIIMPAGEPLGIFRAALSGQRGATTILPHISRSKFARTSLRTSSISRRLSALPRS